MNVTQLDAGKPQAPATRRAALYPAVALAAVGLGLLVHAALTEARLEVLLVALGLGAAAALVGLLALAPSSDVVVRHRD